MGLLLSGLLLAASSWADPGPRWTQSRLAFSEELGTLFAIHRDASTVVALDSTTGEQRWSARVGSEPRNIDLTTRQGRTELLVSCEGSGEVWILDPKTGAVGGRLAVGAGPRGFTVFRDRYLAVALFPLHRLAVWDLETRRPVAELAAPRFPTAVIEVPQTESLYVTHFFDRRITVFDRKELQPRPALQAVRQANQVSALVAIDEGRTLLVPHVTANDDQPDLTLANTIFPVLSEIPTDGSAVVERPVAFIGRTVNGPESAAFLPRRGMIVSVNSRSNDLTVFHRQTVLANAHIEVGTYPLGIVADRAETRAFVLNALDHTLSVIDLETYSETERWRYGEEILPERLARGRRFFNDAHSLRMVLGQWMTCSNCHPEGGTDGRVWRLPDRPPLLTKDLRGFSETRPGGWLASFDEMQDEELFIRKFFLGEGLSKVEPHPHLGAPNEGLSDDLDALSEYVYSLRHGPSPHLVDGRPTDAARRGQDLFHSQEVGCATCHPPPNYTLSSLKSNSLFAGLIHPESAPSHRQADRLQPPPSPFPPVDVPSLLGLATQPAFLHDGRSSSLIDVFRSWNRENRHGRTNHLSTAQLEDLEAFLLSLPWPEDALAEKTETEAEEVEEPASEQAARVALER